MRSFICGAGAQGRVILDILRACDSLQTIDFVDENKALWGTVVNGALVRGNLEQALTKPGAAFILALGNPKLRLAVAQRIQDGGGSFLNAIHPSAVVMPSVQLGAGNMIGATAVVNTNASIGNHTIINTGAVVEHDCVIADGAQISPGAHLGARVRLDSCAFVATGAIVVSRMSIGAEAVVAAGAVVTRDLPARVLAKGIPARICERLDTDFDWSRVL
jgi:sugar O-acyltransferase (sialic acid O-acetyltransferase NeuD family)